MKVLTGSSRSMKVFLFSALALALVLAAFLVPRSEFYWEWHMEGKAKLREEGGVKQSAINMSPIQPVSVKLAGPSGFTPQTRMGFHMDNEWEPAIAADRFGHVYMIYPEYGGVPGCPSCYSPTMIYQMSSDHGTTWSSPTVIYPPGSNQYQVDAQVVVDPADGKTVYVSWLQNNKSDILVGKSTDNGATWSFVTADHTNAGTDKPILAVRGQNVYVSYDHTQTAYVAYSYDGGASFTEVKINQNAKLGWSLGGGGTVTPNGTVYFSWDGYEQNGGAKGNVNLYISKSSDGGVTWTTKLIDISKAPPDCSAFNCGWAFLGAAMTMTSDANGTLYGLWNAGSTAGGPERVYFSKSTDGGDHWSTKVDISTAPAGTHHAFPAIVATGNGDVRIAWMDARAANGGMNRWNVYYRRSTNGGSTWGSEVDISTYDSSFPPYIFVDGFQFPFGDYFEMDIDEEGTTHVIWGEGDNYDSPGSIWYAKGQ
jgi:BNR repeat protein